MAMDTSRSILLCLTISLTLPACTASPQPLHVVSSGVSAEVQAKIMSDYLVGLRKEWSNGTIYLSTCDEANIAVDCDYYIEHDTVDCLFGVYLLEFPGTHFFPHHFKSIPDERAFDCAS